MSLLPKRGFPNSVILKLSNPYTLFERAIRQAVDDKLMNYRINVIDCSDYEESIKKTIIHMIMLWHQNPGALCQKDRAIISALFKLMQI